jgi:hypothetical protein
MNMRIKIVLIVPAFALVAIAAGTSVALAQDAPGPVANGPKVALTSCTVLFAVQSAGQPALANFLFGLTAPARNAGRSFQVTGVNQALYQSIADRLCTDTPGRIAERGYRLATNEFEGQPGFSSLQAAGAPNGLLVDAQGVRYQAYAASGRTVTHPSLVAGVAGNALAGQEATLAGRVGARIMRVVYTVDFATLPSSPAQQAGLANAPSPAEAINYVLQLAIGLQFSNLEGASIFSLRRAEVNYTAPTPMLYSNAIANLVDRGPVSTAAPNTMTQTPAPAQPGETSPIAVLRNLLLGIMTRASANIAAALPGNVMQQPALDLTINPQEFSERSIEGGRMQLEAAMKHYAGR